MRRTAPPSDARRTVRAPARSLRWDVRRCCVESDRPAQDPGAVDVRSDGSGEFGEPGSDAAVLAGLDAEFVVATPNILHQRLTAHDPLAPSGHA
jgi:hypothetical protein